MDAIRTERLSKRYGATLALDRLDLVVVPGEVYGYLGPNGAGKTTTIRLLLGLHRPTGGRAELFGVDAWRDPVTAHQRVAYVAGEPCLWPSLNGAETLELLARMRGSSDAAYRALLVERFELDTRKKVRALSKGSRDGLEVGHVLAIYTSSQIAKRAGRYGLRTSALYGRQGLSGSDSPRTYHNPELTPRDGPLYGKTDPVDQELIRKLPDERYGLLMVFRTFDRASFALVMEASRPVALYDAATNP